MSYSAYRAGRRSSGTEFPAAAASRRDITGLPVEIFSPILSRLHCRDLKSVRLTSRFFLNLVRPLLDRVFFSASPRDVEVARAGASHETFRKAVVEIIWYLLRCMSYQSIVQDSAPGVMWLGFLGPYGCLEVPSPQSHSAAKRWPWNSPMAFPKQGIYSCYDWCTKQ
jgi:hypothetical protein